jgi:hypothetical protein
MNYSSDNAIDDFKANIPNHFKYPMIESYKFTEKDKNEIQKYITSLEKSTHIVKGELHYKLNIREFIGVLARDRVNEIGQGRGPPILSWD